MTLSSRAKAFSVDSLLHSPPSSSSFSSSLSSPLPSSSSSSPTSLYPPESTTVPDKDNEKPQTHHNASTSSKAAHDLEHSRQLFTPENPQIMDIIKTHQFKPIQEVAPESLHLPTQVRLPPGEYASEFSSPPRRPSSPDPPFQCDSVHEMAKDKLPSKDKMEKSDDNIVVDDPVTTCFCHGDMSFCMHPGIINATDRQGSGKTVSVELLHSDLWFKFHRLGTEMIITKSGRRMFPSLKLRVSGLDPTKMYETRLEFLQPDCKKYRYIYHSSTWMISGSGDSLASTPSHVSPECPMNGHAICSQALSFERLKLTNSEHSRTGQVSLVSMQKFQPQIVIQEVRDGSAGSQQDQEEDKTLECYNIAFVQTAFMAVTAYQNQQITTLKIASNPFAKGFRDSGKLRYPYEGKIFGHHHPSASHLMSLGFDPSRAFLPSGHPMLDLGRKRSHLHPWELEAGEKCSKAMRMDLFHSQSATPAPHPLLLMHQPYFGLNSFPPTAGYPPSLPSEHNNLQTNLFRPPQLPLLRQDALIPRENDLGLTLPHSHSHSLSSFSSPSSPLSPPLSSPLSLSSPSLSQLQPARDHPSTSPISNLIKPHKNQNEFDIATLRLGASTSCLNSSNISSPPSNYENPERTRRQHSLIKRELQSERNSPFRSESHINTNNNNRQELENKETALQLHLQHPSGFAPHKPPLMPINNFVDNDNHQQQHERQCQTNTHTHNSKTADLSEPSCANCTTCLNESLKLIPYLYRPPFGIHGQYHHGNIFTPP